MYIVTEDNFLDTIIKLPDCFTFTIGSEEQIGYFEMYKRNKAFQFNYMNYFYRDERPIFETKFFLNPIAALNFLIREIEKVSPDFVNTFLIK